jgi:P27 family predicted phage terminase small subunit
MNKTNRKSETPQPGKSDLGHPHNEAAQDKPDVGGKAPSTIGELECPAELPPLARQEWERIVGELTVLGILSRFDRGALAVYCGAFAIWAEVMEALQKYGTMIKSPNGFPMPSPYLAIVNRQAETMIRIACEFGFTPAARSRNFSFSKSNSMLLEIPRHTTGEDGDL